MQFSIFSLDRAYGSRLSRIGSPIVVPSAFGGASAAAEDILRDALDADLVTEPGQYLVVWVWDDYSCACRTFTVARESRLVVT